MGAEEQKNIEEHNAKEILMILDVLVEHTKRLDAIEKTITGHQNLFNKFLMPIIDIFKR